MEGYFSPSLAIISCANNTSQTQDCDVFDLYGNPKDDISVPQIPESISDAQITSTRDAIFVIGGKNSFNITTGSCYKLDLKEMAWHRIRDLNTARICHTACAVGDHILVTGGFNKQKRMLASSELYSISRDTWINVDDFPPLNPESRYSGIYEAASCEWRGKCVVSAFEKVHVFDPSSCTWSFLGNLVEPRHGHSMAVCDDTIYVIGGTIPKSIEIYDETSKTFIIVKDYPVALSRFNAACHGKRIILSGGYGHHSFKGLGIYDVCTNEITEQKLTLTRDQGNYPALIHYSSPPKLEDLIIMAMKGYFHGMDVCEERTDELPLPKVIKNRLFTSRKMEIK